jgi:predicted acetyltransferase
MAAAGFEIRRVREEELPAMLDVGMLAFHERPQPDDERERLFRFLRSTHRYGAYDAGDLVGCAAALDFEVSIPGGSLPCAGLTWVAVLPTHRRRGALTALMDALLADAARAGPLAALWASEGAIYGRYGFGVATFAQGFEFDARAPLVLRVEPDPRPLRLIELDAAPGVLASTHARERTRRAGLMTRSPEYWREVVLHTGPEHADLGLTEARVVVLGDRANPAGYAIYRVRGQQELGDDDTPGRVDVAEVVADTPAVAAALWRYLASIDLIESVRAENRPADDPPILLAADAYGVRLKERWPAAWLRILDVPAALAARSWATDVAMSVAVRDDRFPANAGTWRIVPGACDWTDAAPDLELDVRDLGSAYLGGVPLGALHAAGLVLEHTTGAVAALDAALRTPLAPFTPDDF